MGKEEKNKKDFLMDVFEESAKEVLDMTNSTVVAPTIPQDNVTPGPKTMTPLQAKNWSEINEAMNTYHTERFNRVLQQLPDREFARVYLKALPFFKQHASKNTTESPTTVNQINITVHRSGEDTPETKTIEID